MIHSTPASALLRVLRALLVWALPLCGLATAQAHPLVNGHFENQVGYHHYDVTVNAVELPNGRIVGHIAWVHTFDNGVSDPIVTSTVSAIDEARVIGNRAFLRVGSRDFVFEDGGEGENAPSDRFFVVRWLGTLPPFEIALGFLQQMMNLFGTNNHSGQVQVHG